MDINEMTIGQFKELAAMFGLATQAKSQVGSNLIGQKVIVRAYRAGVHYGTLKAIEGEVVTLTDARRLWFWEVADKKGISLSDVAEHGISKNSKVCAVNKEQIIIDACEIMTTSETAQKGIEAANDYRP